jgi:hypothetical protein
VPLGQSGPPRTEAPCVGKRSTATVIALDGRINPRVYVDGGLAVEAPLPRKRTLVLASICSARCSQLTTRLQPSSAARAAGRLRLPVP